MIYLNQGDNNTVTATCSANKMLTGTPTYLWAMRHKLTNQSWKSIPYKIPPSVDYNPTYDLFTIKVDNSIPEVYTASTSANTVNLHLIPGQYFVKIYEQQSTTNLNPNYSYDVVYEGIAEVISSGTSTTEVSYSGTSDIFIVYEG